MKRYPKGTWMLLSSPEMLKVTMDRRDFTLSRLARYAGCSKSMVGHLVTGHKKSCTPELALRIAEALDVPLELLFVPMASTPRRENVHTARKKVPA